MSWEDRLAALIERRTGIQLGDRQLRPGVQQLVDGRCAELGVSSSDAYVDMLDAGSTDGPEFSRLIKAITVGYSYFFRDPTQIEVLVTLAGRAARHSGRTVQIWSACCATGQEPYTLAMRCLTAGLSVRILATDMNSEFLDLAKAATYSQSALKHVPPAYRRFFSEGSDGRYRVTPEVRSLVTLQSHNLLWNGPAPRAGVGVGWDLIVCRNAYIYFSPAARTEVTARFSSVLGQTGWLFLGASETLTGVQTQLVPIVHKGRVGYRKRGPGVQPLMPTPAPALARTDRPRPPPVAPLQNREPDDSDDVDAAMQRGHRWLLEHDFDKALEAYTIAQRLNPLRADVHYAAGVVHRKLGDLDLAQMALRRALFLQPDYWPASYLIAGVYDRLGRPAQRRRALQQTRDSLQSTRVPVSASPTLGAEAFEVDPDQILAQTLRQLSS